MEQENGLRSEGDRYLIAAIKRGDENAFRDLVQRYGGRLKIFAARRLMGRGADAEDAVQEAFLGLLQSLDRIDRVRSLQAYLFQILRNKIIDLGARSPEAHGMRRIPLAAEDAQGEVRGHEPVAAESTPSSYVRREETATVRNQVLADVLETVIDGLKEDRNFRDLKVLELLFNGSRNNREIARVVGVSEPTITRIKAAGLERLARLAAAHRLGDRAGRLLDTDDDSTGIIRQTWQDHLLSCLKRSTLGAYALGTLEAEWNDYTAFHLDTVGCETCQVNLEDMQSERPSVSERERERIFASSVGFLKKARR